MQCRETVTLLGPISSVNLVSVHLYVVPGLVTESHNLNDSSSLKSLVEIVSLSLSPNVCLSVCLTVCLSVCLSLSVTHYEVPLVM